MLSTLESIDGKVDRTLLGSRPFSYGVYRFGSNVSVCDIPPAIHRMITVSAVAGVGGMCLAVGSFAQAFGAPAASAASVVADAVLRKSRRVGLILMRRPLVDQL